MVRRTALVFALVLCVVGPVQGQPLLSAEDSGLARLLPRMRSVTRIPTGPLVTRDEILGRIANCAVIVGDAVMAQYDETGKTLINASQQSMFWACVYLEGWPDRFLEEGLELDHFERLVASILDGAALDSERSTLLWLGGATDTVSPPGIACTTWLNIYEAAKYSMTLAAGRRFPDADYSHCPE